LAKTHLPDDATKEGRIVAAFPLNPGDGTVPAFYASINKKLKRAFSNAKLIEEFTKRAKATLNLDPEVTPEDLLRQLFEELSDLPTKPVSAPKDDQRVRQDAGNLLKHCLYQISVARMVFEVCFTSFADKLGQLTLGWHAPGQTFGLYLECGVNLIRGAHAISEFPDPTPLMRSFAGEHGMGNFEIWLSTLIHGIAASVKGEMTPKSLAAQFEDKSKLLTKQI
jgi:hypothetical protein